MTLAAAAYQGGLLLSQGEQRQAHFDHFKRRLDLCQHFGIPTLLVVADFVEQVDQTALERAVVSLGEAARWAQAFGVRLALEFRGRSTFCSSLDTALALVRACGEPNVGVCLDVFHYYTGPSKFEDLALLDAKSLAHVQVCDVAGVARELATRRRPHPARRGRLPAGADRRAAAGDRLRRLGVAGAVQPGAVGVQAAPGRRTGNSSLSGTSSQKRGKIEEEIGLDGAVRSGYDRPQPLARRTLVMPERHGARRGRPLSAMRRIGESNE